MARRRGCSSSSPTLLIGFTKHRLPVQWTPLMCSAERHDILLFIGLRTLTDKVALSFLVCICRDIPLHHGRLEHDISCT